MIIAVLGCGNMASAVVEGIYRHNNTISFITYTPSRKRATELAEKVNGHTIDDLKDIQNADMILIGCKPYQFDNLCEDLSFVDLRDKTILSIMAGVPVSYIKDKLQALKTIRLMPSLPMQYDEGISLIYADGEVSNSEKESLEFLLKKSSQVYILNSEEAFDKLTVVASSGPAYVFYLLDAFKGMLENWGFTPSLAKSLIIQLFKGASKQALVSSSDFEGLLNKVTSNKGVTVEAINSFKENDLDLNIRDGLMAALMRLDDIKEEFITGK